MKRNDSSPWIKIHTCIRTFSIIFYCSKLFLELEKIREWTKWNVLTDINILKWFVEDLEHTIVSVFKSHMLDHILKHVASFWTPKKLDSSSFEQFNCIVTTLIRKNSVRMGKTLHETVKSMKVSVIKDECYCTTEVRKRTVKIVQNGISASLANTATSSSSTLAHVGKHLRILKTLRSLETVLYLFQTSN